MVTEETDRTKTRRDDRNIDYIKLGGYIRRKAAAKYLGISIRTLSEWQRKRIIPFVHVSHRVTLFRIGDLDKAMSRFTVKAVGEA